MAESRQDRAMPRPGAVIGITGNIATGKSTVASILSEGDVRVIDADQVVHDLYADPGSALVQAMAAEFGRDTIAGDGTVDRAALGDVVFNDARALERLEALVHPAVVTEVERLVHAMPLGAPVAIEAIKLIESDLVAMLDAVWLVVATPALQLERLCAKGMTSRAARRRIDAQAPPHEKIAHLRRQRGMDVPVTLLENSGDLTDLRARVAQAWMKTEAQLRDTKEY